MKLTYICNEGVLLEASKAKLLIDAPTRPSGSEPRHRYLCSSTQDSCAISEGLPPFNDPDALLFTHVHADHFWSEAAGRVLSTSAHTQVYIPVSDDPCLDGLRLRAFPNLRWIYPDRMGMPQHFSSGSWSITAYPTLHIGHMFKNTPHYTYLVRLGNQSILHVGDAAPRPEVFRSLGLAGAHITLALLPFNYISLPSAVRTVNEFIRPARIAAFHFPVPALDDQRWIENTMENYEQNRQLLPPVDILRTNGAKFSF